MKGKFILKFLFVLSTISLFGCAGMSADGQSAQFTPQKFESGKYDSKVDGFLFIMDASTTMGEQGQQDFHTAKNFMSSVNQSLPSDLSVNGGLRTFGHDSRQSKNDTDLVYGMTQYSASGLQGGLDSVKYTGGNSPMPAAITAAAGDLEGAGKSSIIIVSDGLVMSNGLQNPSAQQAAADLKAALGDQACIYTVWVGDNPKGKKVMEEVAKAGGCGGAYTATDLTSSAALGGFVNEAFLSDKPAPPPPPTPKPAPAPVPVVKKEVVTFNLLFGFDKADITDEMIPILEQAKMILEEDKSVRFTVAGHTDSTGPEDYNQDLSERRALSVKDWLVNHGIDQARLDMVGYGELRPKYDNSTKEGRKLNRRVELESK